MVGNGWTNPQQILTYNNTPAKENYEEVSNNLRVLP